MSNETNTAPASVDVEHVFGDKTPVAEVLKLMEAYPMSPWIQDRDKLTVAGLVRLSQVGPATRTAAKRAQLVDALLTQSHRREILKLLYDDRVRLDPSIGFDAMCVEMMRTAHMVWAKRLLRSMEVWAGRLVSQMGPRQTALWIERQLGHQRRD